MVVGKMNIQRDDHYFIDRVITSIATCSTIYIEQQAMKYAMLNAFQSRLLSYLKHIDRIDFFLYSLR